MWKKIIDYYNNLTPARVIVAYYVLTVTISTILLSLPISRKPDAPWSFLDGLFTAVSAVSVTGLTTINISETFTTFGIFILILVLQVGGIGIMALGTFFWILVRKKIGLKERRLIMADQNQISLSGLVQLLRQLLLIIFVIELVGALILGTYYLHYFSNWKEAYLNGLFSSVSATTNAGFDITGESLVPFAHDYFVQLIHILLIILGAIGFPVLIELKNFLLRKNSKEKNNFSLNTKLSTITYFGLLLLGAISYFIFEAQFFLKDKSWHESLFYALFHSASTRSGGLVTMDISQLADPTLLMLSGLMFIGASPSSVGGGIRTTTFALTILFFFYFAKGNRSIKIFKREIHEDDVMKAFVVSTLAVLLCFSSVIILSLTEDASLMAIIFEVCSAFGTSGMSLGITADLSSVGKIVIMLLMFIGRVGVLLFIFMIGGKMKTDNFHYPKERIIIG
ncbi:TrkH family potassium uptake protein [Caldibacillus lycopersici]|uniref:TrkH family potassium uptake protein n=1 Tax=Perspicuibacillus lycopersici TaxID=1325689 RepID=A0AAE3IQ09_9BACI|nr:TrkH family potassium uptake protein [Perspicuibacillus lycopersici]MCU9612301.1 TrkH family potassium uptake protein [Perspicuibacillus lycopersici]